MDMIPKDKFDQVFRLLEAEQIKHSKCQWKVCALTEQVNSLELQLKFLQQQNDTQRIQFETTLSRAESQLAEEIRRSERLAQECASRGAASGALQERLTAFHSGMSSLHQSLVATRQSLTVQLENTKLALAQQRFVARQVPPHPPPTDFASVTSPNAKRGPRS